MEPNSKLSSPSELIKYYVCQLLEVLQNQQDPEPPPSDDIVFKVRPRYVRFKLPDDVKEVIVMAITDKGELEYPAWEFPVDDDDGKIKVTHKADQHHNRLHVTQCQVEDTKCTMFAIEHLEPQRRKRQRKILRTTDIEEDGELSVNMVVDEMKDRDYRYCTMLKTDEDDDEDIQVPPEEVHVNLTMTKKPVDRSELGVSLLAKKNAPASIPQKDGSRQSTSDSVQSISIVTPTAKLTGTFPTIQVVQPQMLMDEEYKCMKCKVSFSSKSALSCHFCPTDQKCTFVCKNCNEKFVHYKEFLRHIKHHAEYRSEDRVEQPIRVEAIKKTSFTSPKEIPICKVCNALFPSVDEQTVHMLTHHKTFSCDRCGQEYATIDDLAKHKTDNLCQDPRLAVNGTAPVSNTLTVTSTNDNPEFTCVLCGESFATLRRLQSHKLTHSTSQEIIFVKPKEPPKRMEHACDICCREFISASALTAHSRTHDLVTYACSACKSQFKTEVALNEHKTTCSNEKPDTKHICEHCGKYCANPNALKIHVAVHTGEKAFACDMCNFKFYSKEQLTCHKRIHSEKKFSCSVCPMQFYSKQHFQRHTKHHAKYGNKPMRTRFFHCTICTDVCNSVATMMQHYENAHPLSSFKCMLCDTSFPNYTEVRDHFRIVHEGLMICCCRVCGDVYSSKVLLQKHRAVHGLKYEGGKKKFYRKLGPSKWCPICKKFFVTSRDFQDHLSLNKDCEKRLNEKLNAVIDAECGVCGKTFTLFELLELHSAVHNSEPPYSCTVCSKVLADAVSFDEHIINHHPGYFDESLPPAMTSLKQKRARYVCKVCGRGFPSLSSLTVHSYLHGGEKPFKCTECGVGFSHYSKLSAHHLTHRGEKLFRCSVCWKAFWAKSALLMHLKNHNMKSATSDGAEAKQYLCTVCNRSFSMQSNLTNHMRRHDGEKGILKKIFPCKECKRTFTTKAHLIIHEQMHKGIGLVCPECGKKFTTLAWLQYHMRIHTGESPKCPVCNRGFTTRRAMETHMTSHDLLQGAFMCETCGQTFASNRYLQAHIKLNHTGDVPAICLKCGLGFASAGKLAQHGSSCKQEMGKHEQPGSVHFNVLPHQEVVVTTSTGNNVIVVDQPNMGSYVDDEIMAATSTLQSELQVPLEMHNLQTNFASNFDTTFLQGDEQDQSLIQEVYYNSPDTLTLPSSMSDCQQTVPLSSLVIDNNNIQLPPGFVLDGSQDVVVQVVSSKQLEELLSLNRGFNDT